MRGEVVGCCVPGDAVERCHVMAITVSGLRRQFDDRNVITGVNGLGSMQLDDGSASLVWHLWRRCCNQLSYSISRNLP